MTRKRVLSAKSNQASQRTIRATSSFIELRSQPCRRRIAPESSDAQPDLSQANFGSPGPSDAVRGELDHLLRKARSPRTRSEVTTFSSRTADPNGDELSSSK